MVRHAIAVALVAALPACILGDDGGELDSPYDRSAVAAVDTNGVADGETPVAVGVTGPAGAKLVLQVTGAGSFARPDDLDAPTEKTVFLDTAGEASADIVSATAGVASVAFKPDPRRAPIEIEFHPVALAAGAAVEQELEPGQVIHSVCVAATSPVGQLAANNLSEKNEAPGDVEVDGEIDATAPTGLDCPAGPIDDQPVRGYATLTWTTRTADADLSLAYSSPAGASATADISLLGVPFPGYDVTVDPPVNGTDFLTVDLTVSYLAAGELPAAPAEGVAVTSRFLPDPGPAFLGSSVGDASELAVTAGDGTVTLFFDNSAPGTYAWFLQLTGGVQIQVDDLAIP